MKRSFNSNASANYGCGPCAMSIVTGVEPEYIRGHVMIQRHLRPFNKRGLRCGRKSMDKDDEVVYLPEMESYLSDFFGRKLRFRDVKRTRFDKFWPTLPKNKTFMLHTQIHFQVIQNGMVWDTRSTGGPAENHDFAHDYVDSIMELPGFKIYKKPKPRPVRARERIDEILNPWYREWRIFRYDDEG